MPALSFPFRVDPISRNVATVADGSDQEAAEAIAAHIMVHPGERPMRPEFGTESLPFGDGLGRGSLQLQLTEHGWPRILIVDITNGDPDNGRVESRVTWERIIT